MGQAMLVVQVRMLRSVSAGQGLMLECASPRLMQPGMPHHDCPDKVPSSIGTFMPGAWDSTQVCPCNCSWNTASHTLTPHRPSSKQESMAACRIQQRGWQP